MILCVDIGNSRVKLALFSGNGIVGATALATGSGAEEIGKALRELSENDGSVSAIAVCSVAPRARPALEEALGGFSSVSPWYLDHSAQFPFEVAVRAPEKAGVDRLAAAAAAVHETRSAIVVDVGSAVTIDLVDSGRFRGGAIMPGPGMMTRALAEYSQQLPDIDLQSRPGMFPEGWDNTEDAMALGTWGGVLGGIDVVVKLLGGQCSKTPTIFLTGGWSHKVVQSQNQAWVHRPDMVLEGVRLLAQSNRAL